MKTKVISLDVYGTILPSQGKQVKRNGTDEFLSRCKESGIILCTCSDAEIETNLRDFKEARLDSLYFDKFFKMKKETIFAEQPKDFAPIIRHYNIKPGELFVIGDKRHREINPAEKLGCNAYLVPMYFRVDKKDAFNLNWIKIP